jgi:hypothetical protein
MDFNFKVNGVTIKSPKTFKIEFNPITDGERLLNGKMSIKGIANKLKLTLSYDTITESELITVLGCTWDVFVASKVITQTVSFPYFGGIKTVETYFSPMSVTLTPQGAAVGRWEGLELAFIEL